MRALVLCNACKRHVKRSEAHCPFCSAAVVLPRSPSSGVARGLPGGRAALFLTGALAASACADELEPEVGDDENMSTSDGGKLPGPKDAGVIGDAQAATDAGRDSGILVGPVYGVPIPVDASVQTPKDAGPSCPQVGNLPVPVYGVSIDPRPVDVCRDAGADAGKDAGADAGKDAGKDSGFIAVPPYGIAVPVYGVAIDPNR
jgi:hypothetical protein